MPLPLRLSTLGILQEKSMSVDMNIFLPCQYFLKELKKWGEEIADDINVYKEYNSKKESQSELGGE